MQPFPEKPHAPSPSWRRHWWQDRMAQASHHHLRHLLRLHDHDLGPDRQLRLPEQRGPWRSHRHPRQSGRRHRPGHPHGQVARLMSRARTSLGRRIFQILANTNAWDTIDRTRQELERRGLDTRQILNSLRHTRIRQAIAEALVDIAALTLQHRDALQQGAHFETTVQSSDES